MCVVVCKTTRITHQPLQNHPLVCKTAQITHQPIENQAPFPRSRCAEPWMGLYSYGGSVLPPSPLGLSAFSFARLLLARKKIQVPSSLAHASVPTLLAQSHGPAGRLMPTSSLRSSNHTGEASFPLDHFGYSGRTVEYAVSRPISFYRFLLPFEYIFVSPRQG